jgi:GT2 family glycosyltransferase
MSSISIVIPVRDRKHYTRQILTQLHAQIAEVSAEKKADTDIHVIVVDDGSTDGTQQLIKTNFPEVHLIEADGSLWWAGAIAQGMQYAIDRLNADYFVWLNDDISIAEDFIKTLVCLSSSPEMNFESAIYGGIVRDETYPNWIVFSGMVEKNLIRRFEDFLGKETLEVDTLNGNIVVIPRAIVDQIGLPNAERFRHYGGDFEFLFRAKAQGFKVILSQQLQAVTDYQLSDLIRYMPPWMQWQLAANFSKKNRFCRALLA